MMIRQELGNADERRLSRLFRGLGETERQALLAFAEFLSARETETAVPAGAAAEPVLEPRPETESVVAAIRRLRRGYPMLDGTDLLDRASSLMTAHVLHGKSRKDVIDELELMFATHYAAYRDGSD